MADTIVAPPKAGYTAAQVAIDVIVTTTTGDLAWLSAWKQQLAGARVLIAHDAAVKVSLPAGFEGATCVAGAPGKLSARDLAVLASKAPRILFLAEGCTPATTPKGLEVQVLQEHSINLSTPSTPFFFNTLYDPFRAGADFVRGYPFTLRDGVKAAVSHGLSLGQPDVDGLTQGSKPQASNTRYVDATLTVPKEAMVVFSARNLAIDRSLVGIASYTGLDATGNALPAEADNTWASFCIKAVCNHLGYGCKTGLPYVTCTKPAATPAAVEAEKQFAAKFPWQEEIIEFFQNVKLSATSTTSEQAYVELASQVRQQLGPKNAYFTQLADAMEAWAKAFTAAA